MKKVWLSGLIALVIIGCALFYNYHNRKELKAYEEHIAELTAPRQPSVAVASVPVTEVDSFDEPTESNPLNLNDEALGEEECCPDEEVSELFEVHSMSDTFFEEQPAQSSDSAETSEGGSWLRQHLIKKHGYSPDIDRYLELSELVGSNVRKGLNTMLEWARLEYKYNPDDGVKELLDDFEEIAKHPELITEFWFD